MKPDYQQVLELLASHFQAAPGGERVDWASAAWEVWRQRMEVLAPPASYERLTEIDEIAAALANFEGLLGIAASYESASDSISATQVYEFVRSTAARQLGCGHPIAEDATVGLVRVHRTANRNKDADEIERVWFVATVGELVDLTDEGLVGAAYSAVEAAGFSLGLASAGPAERLRRFLADELWPRLQLSLVAFDAETALEWGAIQANAGMPTGDERANYAAATALTLRRWFPRLAPGLDTNGWRSREWNAVSLGLLRFRDSQEA